MDVHGFEARIWRLERLLVNSSSADKDKADEIHQKTALGSRITKLQNELENCIVDDKSLRDFIENHEPILNPMATPFAVEQELLDSTTKKELVLAASEDLETFANQLKQIKALEHVLESSDIAAVEHLATELQPIESKHRLQSHELAQSAKILSQLMENYNGIVNTVSEIFISWDQMLSTLEKQIAVAERGRA